MNAEQSPLCLRRCCAQHPGRLCYRKPGHDGDHDDGLGHKWMQHAWERAK